MPTNLVNLDALIKREDFALKETDASRSDEISKEIRIEDFEKARSYHKLIRKPDFQRATDNWSPDKIADFIQSVVNGDFIPAVIVWPSETSSKVFVIDGAHRLSAIMAWVHDDYGDGEISQAFFRDRISPEQKRLAIRTRELVNASGIGPYKGLKDLLDDNTSSPEDMIRRARKLVMSTIPVQWVRTNANAAEASFRKINGKATPIDATEASIIEARKKPNAIAARALMHARTGHKYWGSFLQPQQNEIESLAKINYDLLFNPILENPIKTLDLPIAGAGYSPAGFRMIFDLVNMVNDLTPAMWRESGTRKKKSTVKLLEDDETGDVTIDFLRKAEKAANLISGEWEGSLGLHPVVYFYGDNAVFQPVAFLAVITFFQALEGEQKLLEFTNVRYEFEEFLIGHKAFINGAVHAKGSRTRPLDSLVALYRELFSELLKGNSDHKSIVSRMSTISVLDFIGKLSTSGETKTKYRKRFSKNAISEAYIKEGIEKALRCAFCRARLHKNSISQDHSLRREDGGDGNPANCQFTHFRCNTGGKESAHASTLKAQAK